MDYRHNGRLTRTMKDYQKTIAGFRGNNARLTETIDGLSTQWQINESRNSHRRIIAKETRSSGLSVNDTLR